MKSTWNSRTGRVAKVVAGMLAVASPASAQTSDVEASDRFFEKGRAFADVGRLDLACPLFDASYRLDPTLGSLLHVAACHEHEGRLATAWKLFSQARAQAVATGQLDRKNAAEGRLASLGPRLARARLEAPLHADTQEWVIRVDGAVVPLPAPGEATPMDAGQHRVEVQAPGFEPFVAPFVLRDGGQVTVPLGPLVPLPEERTDHARGGTPWTGAHTAAAIVGSAGIVALGVGAGFGLDAASRFDEVEDHCRTSSTPWRCDATGVEAAEDVETRGAISTVALTLGGVALATAVVTWVLAERAGPAPVTGVAVAQGPGEVGLSVARSF